MTATRIEVLRLYKNLMLYSKSLTLTDVAYFKRRIASEFRCNKTLTKPEEIDFAFKIEPMSCIKLNTDDHERQWPLTIRRGRRCCKEGQLYKMFTLRRFNIRHLYTNLLSYTPVVHKHTIDYSKVPKISEHDLSEQFVRGGGPGGSAVNKNANCVVLTHVPTGTVVKCHISRCQDENRKLAREMLIEKLDEVLNGDDSVAAQKKRQDESKYKKAEYKKKKKAKLKEEWKKREGLV